MLLGPLKRRPTLNGGGKSSKGLGYADGGNRGSTPKVAWFRADRTPSDSARDAALLLILLAKAGGSVGGQKNPFWAKVRLTKLVFDSEHRMMRDRVKGFGFFFGAFQHGPSSGDLLGLLDDLEEAGLVKIEWGDIRLTAEGKSIAEQLLADTRITETGANPAALGAIEQTLRELGPLPLQELLDRVYAMRVELPGERPIAVAEAKAQFDRTKKTRALLGLLGDKFYRASFSLSPDWERTFIVVGNPELNPLRSDGSGRPAVPS